MKRLRITDNNIYEFTPFFFWKRCDECGYEFRKEKMWRIILIKRYNLDPLYRDICLHCLPTLQDAINYKENYFKNNPPPPPPPPLPIKKKNILTDIFIDENVEQITFGSKLDLDNFESVVENGVYMLKRKKIK